MIIVLLSWSFDTIYHDILLSRLSDDFGINGTTLTWIASYLTGRVHSVKVGAEHSSESELNLGVPQGSVLGPLVFTLYTVQIRRIADRHGVSVHLELRRRHPALHLLSGVR